MFRFHSFVELSGLSHLLFQWHWPLLFSFVFLLEFHRSFDLAIIGLFISPAFSYIWSHDLSRTLQHFLLALAGFWMAFVDGGLIWCTSHCSFGVAWHTTTMEMKLHPDTQLRFPTVMYEVRINWLDEIVPSTPIFFPLNSAILVLDHKFQ